MKRLLCTLFITLIAVASVPAAAQTLRGGAGMTHNTPGATAAERERCAKVCENVAKRQSYGHAKAAAGDCADFIRSGE